MPAYFYAPMQSSTNTARRINPKKLIMSALLFMMVGTALELYLLDHYEDTLQLIPMLCIGASIIILVVLLYRRTKWTIRLYKLILALTALSGIYGTFLHLQANYEFELEMKPTAKAWDLFVESLSGALPALAPGSMILLALIGYSYLILLKQQQ